MSDDRTSPEDAITNTLLHWEESVAKHSRPIARASLEALAGHGYMLVHVGTTGDWERLARRFRGVERFLGTCAKSLDAMSELNGETR